MSIFKYTLPSGAKYTVETPTGYTQEQADYLFYSQVASGSLVGYAKGQQLASAETKLTKFGLSRLDRGTAGVDILTVLAINSGSPVIATVPNLSKVPLYNPITAADVALIKPTPAPVGPLTVSQTTALIAQIKNVITNPDIPFDNGVGPYNLTTPALEQAGYLKPGTSNYPDFNCVISTPSVWTGKNGVTSLAGIVGDPTLQTQVQNEIMNNSYSALTSGGTIQTTATQPTSISSGQIYTNRGLQTLTAAAAVAGTAAITGNLNSLVTKAFAGAPNIDSLLTNPITNISTIANGAVNSVTQGIENLSNNAVGLANNLVSGTLTSLGNQATGALNSLTGGAASTVASLAGGLTSSVNGAVGGLIANATQFSAPLTAAWAQGSGLLNSALGQASGIASGIAGQASGIVSGLAGQASGIVSGLAGQASGIVSGALGQLTGLASGALSTVGEQATALLGQLGGSLDIMGKMSSFSIDFSLFSSDSLVSPTKVAAGFSNTVNRSTVDAAVQRILGNAKIPTPTFEFPSVGSINVGADIQFAQQQLQSLIGSAQGAITTAANNTVNSAVNSASKTITGLIG